MGKCQSKKAAVRQQEKDEEERMKKLEEQAKAEVEMRQRESLRRAEIERLMKEEQEARLAEEKQEELNKQMLEAQRRQEEEEETQVGDVASVSIPSSKLSSAPSDLRSASSVTDAATTAASSIGDEGAYVATFDMKTFTPWDMTKIDQSAKYVAAKCGCSLAEGHNSATCHICQGIDLSDAPLIA